jgi:hypothetical protein
MYFGKEIEEIIIDYNLSTDYIYKERLYLTKIYPALNKLVENIIHNRKLYEYGDENYKNTKLDCVCYMTNRLSKYTQEKGKAFSYYNRIAINFLIANKKTIERKKYSKVKLSIIDENRNIQYERHRTEFTNDIQDFFEKWSEWGIENSELLFKVKRDQVIAGAIFNLFKNCQLIENYNKKALYFYIREQVDVKTQYITNVLKRLKILQHEMFIEYKNSDTRKWKYFLIKED